MAILNYTTSVPLHRTISQIQAKLAEYGAKDILFEYDEDAHVQSIAFGINGPEDQKLAFRLPVNADKTLRVMENQGLQPRFLSMDHARKVSWRIIKDWLEAQMALLETEMVHMEEIFLPYLLVSKNKTLYEKMAQDYFQLPEGRGQ